jgi:antitoxin YefM
VTYRLSALAGEVAARTIAPSGGVSPISVTIILVMSDTMPLAAVKAHFSEVADRVEKQQERIVVTRNGRPALILISLDDLESLEETLAILSDKRLMAKVRKGVSEADRGQGIPIERALTRRRRG